jgi:hypothetical protein
MPGQHLYYPATRHPWPCLLFVLPLLLAYEAGVFVLGGAHPEALRNGADHWLRCGLDTVGVHLFWVPPALLTLVFVVWAVGRSGDRPDDLIGVLSGMALESVAFALGLWGVSRALAPLLEHFGVELMLASGTESALRQVVTYLGAGIYEEALFRLLLYSALFKLLLRVELPWFVAGLLAAILGALAFSAAHHIGPYGQPYNNYLFLFRLVAGLYFTLLFQLRGFGIAVGAHACYNVVVSVGVA